MKISRLKLFPKGTFVIAIYGLEAAGTRGKCGILGQDSTINQACMAFVDGKSVFSLFLFYYYLANGEKIAFYLSQGTKQQNLSIDAIKFLKIPIPSSEEQQKIVYILSNITNLIESYDKVLESTRKLKKGLMQKLLTKGIGHKKFKKVKNFFKKEILIPYDWEYPKFSQIIQINPSTKITEKKVPYIPMDAVDVENPHVNYYEERDLDSHASLSKFQENDVLFARITPSTENGKTCIIENFSRKGIVSSELTVLRPSEKVVPRYLYYYVKNHRIRQFAISQMMGTTGRQRVPDKVFKKDLSFELPPKSEQQKIASILNTVDSKIDELEQTKSNREFLKKGLMQKLLTGQIRVKI